VPRFLCRLLRHRGHKSLRFWPNWLVVHDFDVSRAKTPFGSYMVVCDRCGDFHCLD
jgi:hypothetical protein